ncbi:MAG: UDP-glucose 4-epimerase GalE [Bacteroidota bacterium]|jgi:UDP-glucose 4-epimerase
MSENRNILVTGGCGYIGSHTVIELIKHGYTPVIADDFRNANKKVLEGFNELLAYVPEIHEIDICDRMAMHALFASKQFHGIIHFAAYKAVGESVENPLKYYHNNLEGLNVVCALALEFGVSNFVFSSSCTVYGEPNGVKEVTESSPMSQPGSPYGNTKLIGEQILADVQRAFQGFKVMNLRYFNPVGAHPTGALGEFPVGKPNNLFPFITQTAIGKQECLTVFGNDYPTTDGTCVRDYIHVCDLAESHVKALKFLEMQSGNCLEYINVGTGQGTTILEVIELFESRSGQKLNWKYGPRRAGDVVEIYANADRSREVLGWKPKYTLADAIDHAWRWEQRIIDLR